MTGSKYTVSIHIAAPGTPMFLDEEPIIDPKTNRQQTSLPGHMFYSLQKNDEKPSSFGFAPETPGRLWGQGKPQFEDINIYRNPAHTRTLEITEEQYKKLREFGNDPEKFGFDLYYRDVRNNCVDFTWAGLNHAGLQRTASFDLTAPLGYTVPGILLRQATDNYRSEWRVDDKEAFRPMRNIEAVDSIARLFPTAR